MRRSTELTSGANRHGRPGATLASNRTVTLRSSMPAGALLATWGVPPKPVVRQTRLKNAPAANAAPTITATNAPQAAATIRSRPRLGTGWMGSLMPASSQRPLQHARAELDDGQHVEQHDES